MADPAVVIRKIEDLLPTVAPLIDTRRRRETAIELFGGLVQLDHRALGGVTAFETIRRTLRQIAGVTLIDGSKGEIYLTETISALVRGHISALREQELMMEKQAEDAMRNTQNSPPAAEADPNGLAPNAPGAKLDAGKQRVWLMVSGFSRALAEVAAVTTVGAAKYTPDGWMSVEDGSARYMDAFGRHMLSLGKGNTVDDATGGTGCLHKAQMIWNLLASLELDLRAAESPK